MLQLLIFLQDSLIFVALGGRLEVNIVVGYLDFMLTVNLIMLVNLLQRSIRVVISFILHRPFFVLDCRFYILYLFLLDDFRRFGSVQGKRWTQLLKILQGLIHFLGALIIKTAVSELNFHICFIFTRMLIGNDAHIGLYDEFVNIAVALALSNETRTGKSFISEVISNGLQEYVFVVLAVSVLLFLI